MGVKNNVWLLDKAFVLAYFATFPLSQQNESDFVLFNRREVHDDSVFLDSFVTVNRFCLQTALSACLVLFWTSSDVDKSIH